MKLNNRIEETTDSKKVTYDYENLTTLDELVRFLTGIEKSYAKIDKIICKSNEEESSKIYDNLESFSSNYTEQDFNNNSIYDIYCSSISTIFSLNKNNKKFSIIESAESKNNIYRYYIFDDSYLVRRNTNTETFYRIINNTWDIIPYMIDTYTDSLDRFDEITVEEANEYISGKRR